MKINALLAALLLLSLLLATRADAQPELPIGTPTPVAVAPLATPVDEAATPTPPVGGSDCR